MAPILLRKVWKIFAALWILAVCARSCSTIVAGRQATLDGSVMASHSNDADGGFNGNLVREAAADWPSGSIRPPGIPQVNHTFSYLKVVICFVAQYLFG